MPKTFWSSFLLSKTKFCFCSSSFVQILLLLFRSKSKFCIILGRFSLLVSSFHFWSALLIFAQNVILADFAFLVALFTFGELFSLLVSSFDFCPKCNFGRFCFLGCSFHFWSALLIFAQNRQMAKRADFGSSFHFCYRFPHLPS